MIYELDFRDRLNDLENLICHLDNIQNSISEKREKYRNFAEQNDIDFNSLETCCKMFERTILIDAYTLAEQLVKNLYYELLEKDNHSNYNLNVFINYKLNPVKFSPNANYVEIEKMIKNDLVNGFKFIVSKNVDDIQLYNSMIQARHTYAHGGLYMFRNECFNTVVNVLQYLYKEFKIIIDKDRDYRISFQNTFSDLKDKTIKVEKCIKNFKDNSNFNKKNLKKQLNDLKKTTKIILNEYGSFLSDTILLESLYTNIISLSSMDLRKLDDCINVFNTNKYTIKNTL